MMEPPGLRLRSQRVGSRRMRSIEALEEKKT
jgi:hypothetical protein